jgi:hypothetical protein
MTDEKSIAPPVVRACEQCIFSVSLRIDRTALHAQRFCYRLPPTGVVQMDKHHATVAIGSLHPVVVDSDWCYEFQPVVKKSEVN